MSQFIKTFSKSKKHQIEKYKKYLLNNNWVTTDAYSTLNDEYFSDLYSGDIKKSTKADITKRLTELIKRQKDTIKGKTEEYRLQQSLAQGIILILKTFVKKATGEQHTKDFTEFVKYCLNVIKIHTDRTDGYLNSVDISKIENQEVRGEEIKLIKECHEGLDKLDDTITALNIQDDVQEALGIEFLNGAKAPLSMHWVLSEIYPEINRKLKSIGVDPEAEPDNTLHIYNDNPPQWNPEKHYWDQEPPVLTYYFKEFKKLREGIVIDGYYISNWMYYHMNVFMTPIPHKVFNEKSKQYESKDKIINPPLRDSDVIIFENYENAKKEKHLITFIAATRRAAKTTLESSKLACAMTIGKKEILCAGGSTKDLNQIIKNVKTDIQYKNAAFAVYNVSNDWKDKVEIGIKNKLNKTILLSTLFIVNTSDGNNEEVLAGFTPDEFVFDEVMKGKFISALAGLKPALKGADGLIRCFPVLSGTGGSEALSKDGMEVLRDPSSNDVHPNDWSLLERGIPTECITWNEDRNKPFGTFIPGQMCVDMPKIESTLADYIGKSSSKLLRQIKLKITDWPAANKKIEEDRDKKKKNRVEYNKEVVYIPIKPSEIFMSGKLNPFPVPEAKAHREWLLESGLWDRRREVYRDSSGRIRTNISTKDLAEYPHKGNIDAPFLIFEDIPEVKPVPFLYTAGFDDYKQDDSDTDSVGTFQIWKMETFGDKFGRKLVASIASKPEKHPKLHEQWHLLMEAYNISATAFGENEDFTIKEYLDRRHLSEKYLAPSVAFTQAFGLSNNLKRAFGWSPAACKKTLFNLFLDYCNEEFVTFDELGREVILKGVQKIDDIWLLEEIINYSENGNFDRITAAMGGFGYIHYLESIHVRPKIIKETSEETQKNQQIHHKHSIYGNGKYRSKLYKG